MKKEPDISIEERLQQTREGFENSFLEGEFYERQTKDDSHLRLLLRELRGKGTEHILDLGTGAGYLAFPMAEQYPECQIYGLDIVNETILRNQRKARELKNCHFISYDGRKFPFEDCFFDRVVSRYALHHFPAIEEAFGEISRVLRRGGLLLISDPIPNPEDENRFVDRFMQMKPDGHIRFYAEEEFVQLAERAGLRKKKAIRTGITFPRKQAEQYSELIRNTPEAVLNSYHVERKSDEIWITEKVANLVFEKL